ncbi:LysR family transcriptional regulator [Vibrio ulleungensis]|uniref:LysR family transcriptional regulator n=1 Tax=Vibrio ulleungensis TaxID=2807619 RepID=A0ABS2HET9_9VIBR|nr:LysR family transcriptional regulator [Vibrio ulleungensis]MBM7035151.1 LysR family transcriptional regulator [Vibrio ulleungensis]
MRTRSDELNILLTVIDSGGFSAAASMLNIQVAKVSRTVSKIEKQLGVTLLNRTTRRIELTEEGRQFAAQIRQGLSYLEQAEAEIVERKNQPKGRLRVDAASPFVLHQLVPLVAEFNAAYPEIELELTSNEGIVDLLEKRTDIAIRIGQLDDSTLYSTLLGESPLFIVASPSYLKINGVPKQVSDLSQHKLLGFTESKTLNQWPLPMETVVPKLMVSNGETLRQLALAGNGIACLSGFMVHQDIEQGRLVSLLHPFVISNTGRERVNAVYYKSSTLSKRITAFIDFIRPRLSL